MLQNCPFNCCFYLLGLEGVKNLFHNGAEHPPHGIMYNEREPFCYWMSIESCRHFVPKLLQVAEEWYNRSSAGPERCVLCCSGMLRILWMASGSTSVTSSRPNGTLLQRKTWKDPPPLSRCMFHRQDTYCCLQLPLWIHRESFSSHSRRTMGRILYFRIDHRPSFLLRSSINGYGPSLFI